MFIMILQGAMCCVVSHQTNNGYDSMRNNFTETQSDLCIQDSAREWGVNLPLHEK